MINRKLFKNWTTKELRVYYKIDDEMFVIIIHLRTGISSKEIAVIIGGSADSSYVDGVVKQIYRHINKHNKKGERRTTNHAGIFNKLNMYK